MINSYFIHRGSPGPTCGSSKPEGALTGLMAIVLCALMLLCAVTSATASEIDYQSLQENPIDTTFRRILTQEVPGWEGMDDLGSSIDPKMGSIRWPLRDGKIAGLFNLRASKGNRRHKGIDMLASKGTPIYAALDGVVEVVSHGGKGWSGYGKIIFICHNNKFWTLYSHCDTINVKIGQKIKQGEQIATVGRTGRATGYHLHFELRDENGSAVDPMRFLPKEGTLPFGK